MIKRETEELVSRLEHGPEEYKLLHPLHGKKMEDSKKLKKVPVLPEWVKRCESVYSCSHVITTLCSDVADSDVADSDVGSTKREIHEILTNQQLAPKKERASDKLPIVISELLKVMQLASQ